jgi:tetratricopeptide (TPR) repeat protein
MENQIKASLESQLEKEPCIIEDTEEMFWLRESDDYQSKVKLGNMLSAQYRFRDAVDAFKEASKIRNNDPMLYIRLAGAYLTLGMFNAAKAAYDCSLELGVSEKVAAYPIGVWHYMKKDYHYAAKWFEKCFPCNDEMAIAVIYWHTLCCLRGELRPTHLQKYHMDMKVGHHTAYKLAVSVMVGETDIVEAINQMDKESDDLNYVVAAYGIAVYLESIGKKNEYKILIEKLLLRNSVWPCISYLAALNDFKG